MAVLSSSGMWQRKGATLTVVTMPSISRHSSRDEKDQAATATAVLRSSSSGRGSARKQQSQQ